MQELLDQLLFHNSGRDWIVAFFVFVSILGIFQLLGSVVLRRARMFSKNTETQIDDVVTVVLAGTRWWFLVILSAYAGLFVLRVPVEISTVFERLVIIALLIQLGLWVNCGLSFWVDGYKTEKLEEDANAATAVSALGYIGKIILWAIVVLLILDNLGVEITSLIAGLGIGGVAVALAVQNILGDLFAALTILLDRPFVIGDFVVVGDYSGTVEYIGLKTTRLRSLLGEQIIFGNNDLLQSRINNFQTLNERRVVFSFGIRYETPYEKVKAVTGMVQAIVEAQAQIRFDRVHFKEFGDFSLNYEVVYYMVISDFMAYMDTQQTINLEMLRQFEEAGIEFAYPTQTVLVEQS